VDGNPVLDLYVTIYFFSYISCPFKLLFCYLLKHRPIYGDTVYSTYLHITGIIIILRRLKLTDEFDIVLQIAQSKKLEDQDFDAGFNLRTCLSLRVQSEASLLFPDGIIWGPYAFIAHYGGGGDGDL